MEERKVEFNCPSCDHQMSMEIQVQEIELPEHVFDHIMDCKDHFERAVDFIMQEFIKDGILAPASGIRQVLKYFDAFCYVAVAEMYNDEGEYIGNESIQSEDSDDCEGEE